MPLLLLSTLYPLIALYTYPDTVIPSVAGLDANLDDLRAIDNITCQFLEAIRDCERDGIDSDAAFDGRYGDKLAFTYTGSDGECDHHGTYTSKLYSL